MKLITFLISILLLGVVIVWNPVHLSGQTAAQKCSEVADGLQFCTKTPRISIPTGNNVIIELSLKNLSEESVSIPQGLSVEDYFDISIVDSNGSKIKSLKDIAIEKVASGVASDEERLRMIRYGSRRKPSIVDPDKELSMELNLSQFYDLNRPDTYEVTIDRKMKDKFGNDLLLSFGSIRVEVK